MEQKFEFWEQEFNKAEQEERELDELDDIFQKSPIKLREEKPTVTPIAPAGFVWSYESTEQLREEAVASADVEIQKNQDE